MDNPFDRDNYATVAPECIVRGQFAGWKLDLDHDDALFTLEYRLREVSNPNADIIILGAQIVLTDAEYWVFEVPSATSTTAAWDVNNIDSEMRWDLILTEISSSNESILKSGFLTIFQSNSARQTHSEVMLGKINSILNGRADDDVSSYSIKSRSISKMSIEELTRWRDYYISEVRRTGGSVSSSSSKPRRNSLTIGFK